MWNCSSLEDTNVKRHESKIRIKMMIILSPNRCRNQVTEGMDPLMVSQIVLGFVVYNHFSHVACCNSLLYL